MVVMMIKYSMSVFKKQHVIFLLSFPKFKVLFKKFLITEFEEQWLEFDQLLHNLPIGLKECR